MTDPSGDQPAPSEQPDQPYQPGQPYESGQPYQPYPYPYPQAQPYAQQYGAPPAVPPRVRGRTPLWIALIFGVVGIVLLVVGGVVGFTQGLQKVDNFSRVPIAAGQGTANFPSAGNYLAYYEAPNVSSSIRQVPLPLIEIRSPSGQTQVLDTLYGGSSRASRQIRHSLTYQYHGHNGVAIYQFHIAEPGRYDVHMEATGDESPGANIAFGKSIAGGLTVGGILAVLGALLIIVAIILLIVGLVQRSRSRKRIAAAQAYGGGPPPGYGGGPPPGYGGGPPPGYGYPPPSQGTWPPQQ